MTIKQITAIAGLVLCTTVSYSQKDSQNIVLKLPSHYRIPGATITLQIDSLFLHYALSQDSLVKFKVPAIRNMKRLHISYSNIGFESPTWTKQVRFIGSDTTLLTFRRKTGGRQDIVYEMDVNQYPLIEFESAESSHEVQVDGDPIGPTSTSHTVKPHMDHNLVWKKGNTKVCEKTVNLEYNQVRKYRCNADGSLTEL